MDRKKRNHIRSVVVTYDGHSTGKLEEFNRMNGEEINCSQTESMGGDTQQE